MSLSPTTDLGASTTTTTSPSASAPGGRAPASDDSCHNSQSQADTSASSDQVDAATSSSHASSNRKEIEPHETEGVRYGKCKWFNVAKGWGFITPNEGGQEVFVHQSVIQMAGFRSLGEQEEVEFECQLTERGLEATRVSGKSGLDCHGSTFRPRTKKRFRRIRCYNCGEFANHIASKCELGPQPKSCHLCKQSDHLFADCPLRKTQTSASSHTSPTQRTEGDDAAT